jgi:glycosyltransferase involved in cell wall biosynthesis
MPVRPKTVLRSAGASTSGPSAKAVRPGGHALLESGQQGVPAQRTDPELAAPAARPAICLAMIVRDESAVIERCLRSVLPFLDYWVICDTGSVDGTPELIARILEGIPGELHDRPWRNFGINRTELLELARGKSDYLLLLDADMTVNADGPMGALSADAYLMRCGGDLEYWVPRLVRASLPWRYVGATHEYLAGAGPYSCERLEAISCTHFADGGARADKLPRDKALLEAELAHRPDDPRTVFYLAQTERDLGNREEAIALYQRRAGMGGFDEEAFYARYQAGVLIAESDPEAALPVLFDAWQSRPSRAEPLVEVARIARDRGWYQLGHAVASAGLDLRPNGDGLFVHRWVYDWELRFEYAIACYWVGQYEAGLQANDEVLSVPGLPGRVRAQAVRNRQWCAMQLAKLGRPVPPPAAGLLPARPALLGDLIPGTRFAQVSLATGSAWPQFNPSLAVHPDGGFGLIVRSANYLVHRAEGYTILADDGVIRTTNYLARLDEGFRLLDAQAISENGIAVRDDAPVLGSEDCRLFWWRDSWWLSATRRDQHEDAACQMMLGRLDGARLEQARVLDPGYPGGRHEKNWMPFTRGDELLFVYQCYPFTVLRWDPKSGRLSEVSRSRAPHVLAGLRGGSQGIALQEGYLFVVHEAHDEPEGRTYSHRFLRISADLKPDGISPQFAFVHEGIEFCAGAARSGDQVALSFGLSDRVAAIATASLDGVLSLIEPFTETTGTRYD